MKSRAKLILNQYQGCQALINLFKQIKQGKNWTNYQIFSRDLIVQLIKKDQELKDNWSENNLISENQLNEHLWKEKLLKDWDLQEFWNRDEDVVNLNDFLHLCSFASKIISTDCAQEQEDEQLVLKNHKQIQVIRINDKIKEIIQDWPLEPVFATQFKNDLKYRLVFKNHQVRSYLVVDIDYNKKYDALEISSDEWKMIAIWISKAHQQLNRFIATTISNRGQEFDDYNLARMTITFLKNFAIPLVKVYWNWTYNAYLKCIRYGDNQDFWLWDEHEWDQHCYEAQLNCIFENGVYEQQRLRVTIDDLIELDDHHYGYSVQNFHQDQNFDAPALRWKFPSFYQVFDGQEMIVFDPDWIANREIKGIQAGYETTLPKQLLKEYLIGINISDCQDLQTLQQKLNEISNVVKINPLTNQYDFGYKFNKLVIICHRDD